MSILTKSALQGNLLGLLFASLSFATTHPAATCSTADVQNAINSAASGDTVTIPAGTCVWSSGVTLSGKGITISGQGSGRIVAYSSNTLAIGTGSKSLTVATTQVGRTLTLTAGQTITLSETGTRTNFMTGTVTSYSSGSLVVNVTSTGGSCGANSLSNCKRWIVSTPSATVITNNDTSTYLFTVTEDTAVHTNISGIHFAAGSGTVGHINLNYTSGGQAILIHDCWMETGTSTGASVHTTTNRGVISNCSFDSSPFSMAPLAFQSQADSLQTSWSTPSTMGMSDTTGQNNSYIESSDFHAFLNATDYDNNSRGVFRYNFMNNAGFGTHGLDTSLFGQRHFEYYNNIGNYNGYNDGTTFNMNWWIFVRGGTYVVYNNTLPALQSTDYGTKADILMTEMDLQRNAGAVPCWGAGTTAGAKYYAPHQVGIGYVTGAGVDGGASNSYSLSSFGGPASVYAGDPEPAYAWANSRQPLTNVSVQDYGLGQSDSCPSTPTPEVSTDYIKANRDFFNTSTPKPGWAPYTYPHPLAQSQTQTGGGSTPPSPPSTVTASIQ
jgi:hypothetical protein